MRQHHSKLHMLMLVIQLSMDYSAG